MLYVFMWIAIMVGAGIAGLLLYAATLSDTFSVSRTRTIAAPPSKIYPLIADVREMNAWNPFAKQDPSIRIHYGAQTSGPGASYSWTSNGRAGQGRLSVSGVVPYERLDMLLEMEKPIAARNDIAFILRSRDGGNTDVTWSMSGSRPFIGKVLDAVFNMDRMVGGSFEKGLGDLKEIVERQ